MSTLSQDDVRRNPDGFVALVERGEPVTLTAAAGPIAEVMPVEPAPTPPRLPRPFGLAKGEFVVPDDFDDPLPDEILKEFSGE